MGIQDKIRELSAVNASSGVLLSAYLNWERCDGSHRKRIQNALKKREREILQDLEPEPKAEVRKDFREIMAHLRKGFPAGTQGVCIFACGEMGLFESHASPFPFKTQVVLGSRPFLLPLARVSDEHDHGLVSLIDTESARLIEIMGSNVIKEQEFHADVPGRHAQGGWSQMRYQRHIEDHRDRHHRNVAEVLTRWVDESRVPQVILGGQERILANFQEFLPGRVRSRILVSMPLDIRAHRDEALRRAQEFLQSEKERAQSELVRELLEVVLTEGPAVVGPESTIRALNEGRVGRLVINRDFSRPGLRCPACDMLHWKDLESCPYCGDTCIGVSLEAEIVTTVIHKGGEVITVMSDPNLERHGGMGAFLRFQDSVPVAESRRSK
jgi:peptide chain release factor subunit 1